jgi:hypothetical protein
MMKVGLVLLADVPLGRGGGVTNLGATLFFVFLLSPIPAFHDRYRPAHEVRRGTARRP